MNAQEIGVEASKGRVSAKLNNNCFACGPAHPHGLRLIFSRDEQRGMSAWWDTSSEYEGFQGVIHGGIISTVLDEAMAKAVAASGTAAFTCELRLRLRRPVAPGERLHINGWVVEKQRRKILAEAALTDAEGRERAHAWATFLEPPESPAVS